MPTFSKIPLEEKAKGAIVNGGIAVFGSLLKVGPAMVKLQTADEKKGIPAYGYITITGIRFYYCRYGFLNDPDIYKSQKKLS